MTGLYSEAQDDSSADLPPDNSESESTPNNVDDESKNIINATATGGGGGGVVHQLQAQSVTVSTTLANPSVTTTCITSSSNAIDTVIKCHSRQPSNSAGLMEKNYQNEDVNEEFSRDCGILSCRPANIQKLARIKVGLIITTTTLIFSLLHSTL